MTTNTLDSIVREYLLEVGDSNLNRYARLMTIAVSGLREIRMDVSGVPTTILLTVTDSDAANLPHDFVSLIRVAICDAGGNLKALGMNENMCLPRDFDKCGNDAIDTDDVGGGFGISFNGLEGFSDNIRNGEFVGRMFGLGGGGNIYGNYRIDWERGTINFGNLLTGVSTVVLEYLSDLSLVNGDYQAHPFIIETLKAWIYWKDIQRKVSVGLGEKQIAERQYYLAEKQSKRRFSNHTIQEWLQAFRQSNKSAPKF